MTEHHDHSARHAAPNGPPPGYSSVPATPWYAPSHRPPPPPPPATVHAESPAPLASASAPDRTPPAEDEGAGPRPPVPQRIWCVEDNRMALLAMSVWTERVPGRGEDADPFVADHQDSRQGVLAVFDGSGGAGAAPAWQAPDGEFRTGAWVGARVARLATDAWFHDVAAEGEPAEPETLRDYLRFFLEHAPQRRSKISGTMRRQLPTTLAALHYKVVQVQDEVGLELRPLWAGDSRAYVLRPRTGLQVLTRDHTRESDALELLRSDPPMTNLVCADREFEIDGGRVTYPLPCVLVTATDGFFGYVHTPADFETLLLRTLRQAGTVGEWADLVRREVQSYTADDASLAVVALGYDGFADLRARFSARLEDLKDRYVRTRPRGLDRLSPSTADAGSGPTPTPEDAAELPARVGAWQDATWHSYRAGYETHLPLAPEERA
ncbi:serine/threonine protein phosphatase [Streptomyces sp. NPDC005303]|uniref:serine/threonine protein phosphatase n=1 Tax=Streptomyces sp. NPDC005303 TaxID=3155713 RepID=UPI0033ADAB4B